MKFVNSRFQFSTKHITKNQTYHIGTNYRNLLPPHGGNDPGKIGVDDSLEKDINLIIARKVQTMLEQQDVEVVMTREEDIGLYDENASNKKAQDLKNRCALINETQPDCVVSIHQNSYHEEYVSGAQVFYYGTSADAQRLAQTLQAKLVSYLDPENTRQAKANESYYLLKKTEAPIAIVECGFLSNWEEAKKLQEESYQSRVAWAVTMGVMEYLNESLQ
ncbi:MAG: N-acetylmuramoyl-L-alanine amidase [Lachnospiraceae bacterium]|nr:N-acetylmuramoyl-L-alanine amidase [Lachnospiraceae bacterium]